MEKHCYASEEKILSSRWSITRSCQNLTKKVGAANFHSQWYLADDGWTSNKS